MERVKEITDGKGFRSSMILIGGDTFLKSLDCLRPLGLLASFGQASGPVSSFDPALLAAKGLSLFDPADADDLHR